MTIEEYKGSKNSWTMNTDIDELPEEDSLDEEADAEEPADEIEAKVSWRCMEEEEL